MPTYVYSLVSDKFSLILSSETKLFRKYPQGYCKVWELGKLENREQSSKETNISPSCQETSFKILMNSSEFGYSNNSPILLIF